MKIHCIEGLGCFHLRPLTKAVQSFNLGVEVVTYPWTVRGIPVEDGDICAFHSFGLGAFDLVKNKDNVTYFVLDGRMPKWGTPYKGILEKPLGDRVYNYYQPKGLNGYPIRGAINHFVELGGLFAHYRMPTIPKFLFKLMEVVHESKSKK